MTSHTEALRAPLGVVTLRHTIITGVIIMMMIAPVAGAIGPHDYLDNYNQFMDDWIDGGHDGYNRGLVDGLAHKDYTYPIDMWIDNRPYYNDAVTRAYSHGWSTAGLILMGCSIRIDDAYAQFIDDWVDGGNDGYAMGYFDKLSGVHDPQTEYQRSVAYMGAYDRGYEHGWDAAEKQISN